MFTDVVIVKNGQTFKPSDFWSKKNLDENGDFIDPKKITKSSGKRFLFECQFCGHEFSSKLDDISRKRPQWCGYCAGKRLCLEQEECEICFFKSFASNERSEFWLYDKNIGNPGDFLLNAHVKKWFYCNICDHEFEKQLDAVSAGRWCPYCKGDLLCDDEDCKICYKRSFASHKKANCWHPENKLLPRHVRLCSNRKIWFICDICNHEFESILDNISRGRTWCPYCCPTRVVKLCSDEDCEQCYNRSFASHPKAEFCTSEVNLRMISMNTHTKLDFICDVEECQNKFSMRVNNVAQSQWCPLCKKKTERIFKKYLEELFPGQKIQHEKRFDWCKNPETNRHLPFDFFIPHLSLIVEIDGRQHTEQVYNWDSPEKTQKKDKIKEKLAAKNGMAVLRFLQEDIFYNRTKWKQDFEDFVKSLRS